MWLTDHLALRLGTTTLKIRCNKTSRVKIKGLFIPQHLVTERFPYTQPLQSAALYSHGIMTQCICLLSSWLLSFQSSWVCWWLSHCKHIYSVPYFSVWTINTNTFILIHSLIKDKGTRVPPHHHHPTHAHSTQCPVCQHRSSSSMRPFYNTETSWKCSIKLIELLSSWKC